MVWGSGILCFLTDHYLPVDMNNSIDHWWNRFEFCSAALVLLLLVIVYVVLAFVCHGLTLPTCLKWRVIPSQICICFPVFNFFSPSWFEYMGFFYLSFHCCKLSVILIYAFWNTQCHYVCLLGITHRPLYWW